MTDKGRIVPPHASGGGCFPKPSHICRQDPDETDGQRLYRAYADAQARRDLAYDLHKVRLKKEGEIDAALTRSETQKSEEE